MNILILAPHTDDAEYGCGGLIQKYIKEGHHVKVVALSHIFDTPDGVKDLSKEFYMGMKILGVSTYTILDFNVRTFSEDRQKLLDVFIRQLETYNPQIILVPQHNDPHQDHQTVTNEAIRAFKFCTILGYEGSSKSLAPKNNYFVEITKAQIDKKEQSFSCYKSQMHRAYYGNNFLTSRATVHGVLIGEQYAEAYEVIRIIHSA